jgi:hypothetical protein
MMVAIPRSIRGKATMPRNVPAEPFRMPRNVPAERFRMMVAILRSIRGKATMPRDVGAASTATNSGRRDERVRDRLEGRRERVSRGRGRRGATTRAAPTSR